MGWWSIGQDRYCGDGPADSMDGGLKEIRAILVDRPTADELREIFRGLVPHRFQSKSSSALYIATKTWENVNQHFLYEWGRLPTEEERLEVVDFCLGGIEEEE